MENISKQTDYIRTVGRRKTASARVRLSNGKGEIVINGRTLEQYFPYFELQNIVIAPLKDTGKQGKMNLSIKVAGGGQNSQAIAIQHGVARALSKYDAELKKILKTNGYLTRDSRVKERKKPGLKKARRAPQWKKR
ncbi:MAG: 30S ribosomal protein S9 [bacterium]